MKPKQIALAKIIQSLGVIGWLFIASLGHATPPLEMDLAYDQAKGTLDVRFVHPSTNRNKHFIRRIEVIKNNEEPTKYFYGFQPAAREFTYTYDLKAGPQDIITVKAHCEEGGTKEATLVIPLEEDPVQQEPPAPTPEEPLELEPKDGGMSDAAPSSP
jgi:hypothetical protein